MEEERPHLAQRFNISNSFPKILIAVLVVALLGGVSTGYFLSSTNTESSSEVSPEIREAAKSAQQDNRTFRDFAEGKISPKPEPKAGESYTEGTHLLIRQGAAPVALTSSVVDLSEYEGKEVKVFGETQKALKEGWLMDVGRVEEK